jgi:5-methyltetrahydropteroyltriglutamate--homocysteine methyltransferase
MKRSSERFLTTHVGSLVRPAALRAIIGARENEQPYDEANLTVTLRQAVQEVVAKQAEVGIDIVDDGEYGKTGWNRYVAERMDGFVHRALRVHEKPQNNFDLNDEVAKFPGFYAAYSVLQTFDWDSAAQSPAAATSMLAAARPRRLVWECVGPIKYKGHAAIARDIENLKAAVQIAKVEEAFLPVAAPMSARGNWLNSYYSNEADLMMALADALKQEYRAIIDAGLLLQIDDPFLADQHAKLVQKYGEKETRRRLEQSIELLNYALAGVPEDRVRYHVCWGSWNAPHTTDVPLKKIVDIVLKVHAQAYSLEAANPRHEHEWQIWKDVKLPDGKLLIPGLISHVTNVVEHPELVAWRIGNFVSVVGRDNIIAGSDCGFSQSYNHMRVHPSVQWAKLESLVEGALIATRQHWSQRAA